LGNCEEVGNSRTLLSRDSPGKVVVWEESVPYISVPKSMNFFKGFKTSLAVQKYGAPLSKRTQIFISEHPRLSSSKYYISSCIPQQKLCKSNLNRSPRLYKNLQNFDELLLHFKRW
jgi:hypothetical protein